tara:strand:- start:11072 stop:11980 length:909 start_codon:yes stop_codon:yes gene_type:complete
MKKLLNSLICLIGILGIAVVIIEIISRFYFSEQYNISNTARQKPDELIQQYITRTRAVIPTNTEDEYVVFFGDSFTYGDTLPLSESYPKVFERCLQRKGSKLKVINVAVQGSSFLDHFQVANRFLNVELANTNIKKVILGVTDNDQYIEHWGYHPYDTCQDLYPYSNTRFLHHHLFSAYYLDYLLNVSNRHVKDKNVESRAKLCLKRNIDNFKSLIKEKNLPLQMTFLIDAMKDYNNTGVLGVEYVERSKDFAKKFDLDFIVINEAFKNLSSDRDVYAIDNYHFNASTNAIIGEYLCEHIKI